MAINNIPGVGPTNADIATAVAAPSAATIAAAVAAPSAATIAAAVAAPSSATITAAVTAAGNSAGWGSTGGATWTAISTPSINGVSSLNFSLSGYKYYKVVFANVALSANSQLWFQFNGVSTNTYSYGSFEINNVTLNATSVANNNRVNTGSHNYNAAINGYALLENANLSGAHTLEYEMTGRNGAPSQLYAKGYGNWDSTAAITSMQVFVNSVTFTTGAITLWGGN